MIKIINNVPFLFNYLYLEGLNEKIGAIILPENVCYRKKKKENRKKYYCKIITLCSMFRILNGEKKLKKKLHLKSKNQTLLNIFIFIFISRYA